MERKPHISTNVKIENIEENVCIDLALSVSIITFFSLSFFRLMQSMYVMGGSQGGQCL